MALLTSVEARAYADRRLLLVDASDYMDDVADVPMPENPDTRIGPPGAHGCWLQAPEERDVMINVLMHDGPEVVSSEYEHVEFGSSGSTFAVRGLFGDRFIMIAASAPRWHVAAAYYSEQWYWRLQVWPAQRT